MPRPNPLPPTTTLALTKITGKSQARKAAKPGVYQIDDLIRVVGELTITPN